MEDDLFVEQVQSLLQQNDAPQQAKDPLAAYKQELNQYLTDMKGLRRMHPEQAMSWVSAVSARVLEMIYMTLESESRTATKFRVEWLIPLRDELRFQYQIVSRRVSNERFEWEMAGGQST
jgi:hypothetical protein